MKKISQIILYVLLSVVVISAIVTAVVKKNFAPNISVPAYASRGIEISTANDTAMYDGLSDENNYKQFVKIYSDSFKLSILYSLFSGKISRKQTIEQYGANAPSFSTGYVVSFDYAESQILKVNGKDYIESVNLDTPVTYKNVQFVVTANRGLKTCYIFFYSQDNSKWYRLTTLANFDNLYNFINELPNFADVE